MAFPTVTETGTIEAADATSRDITLPSFADGDLIIMAVIGDGSQVQTWTHDGATDHWSALFDRANGTQVRMVAKWRKMVAGDSSTVTVSWTNSDRAGWTILLIPAAEWHGTSAPESTTGTSGSSTGANPPAVTPSWGAEDNLAIAICGGDIYVVINSGPSGYTTFTQRRRASDSGSVNIQAAYKQTTASPEDPGNFTYASTEYWVCGTVIVRPAVVVPRVRPIRRALAAVTRAATW